MPSTIIIGAINVRQNRIIRFRNEEKEKNNPIVQAANAAVWQCLAMDNVLQKRAYQHSIQEESDIYLYLYLLIILIIKLFNYYSNFYSS